MLFKHRLHQVDAMEKLPDMTGRFPHPSDEAIVMNGSFFQKKTSASGGPSVKQKNE